MGVGWSEGKSNRTYPGCAPTGWSHKDGSFGIDPASPQEDWHFSKPRRSRRVAAPASGLLYRVKPRRPQSDGASAVLAQALISRYGALRCMRTPFLVRSDQRPDVHESALHAPGA